MSPNPPNRSAPRNAGEPLRLGIILAGPSGTGKTTLGQGLARESGGSFLDGDFLHPRSNIEKMAKGQPLNDQDRLPWLKAVNQALYAMRQTQQISFLACSALKKIYRDRIREGHTHLFFFFPEISYEAVCRRLEQRSGHFFKKEMLRSQFETLEPPAPEETDVIRIPLCDDPSENLARYREEVRRVQSLFREP